jgi:hypothetical protein
VTEVGEELRLDSGRFILPGDAGTPVQDADNDASGLDASFEDAEDCHTDLSGIGAGDFQISFDLTTTQIDNFVALVNQRSICLQGSDYWDIRLNNGMILAEANDNLHLTVAPTAKRINDGASHAVVVRRTSGNVVVTVDGSPSAPVVSQTGLDKLAPLQIGTDVCDGQSTPNADGTVPLSGSLQDLCIMAP